MENTNMITILKSRSCLVFHSPLCLISAELLVWVVAVQSLSPVRLFATPWTAAHQLPYPSPSPRACSNSCPLSQWYNPTISSFVSSFSSCPQSFPASGSFLMSQLFTTSSQSIGASASASVLPKSIQGWFPLGLTGLVSLLSKGLSFANSLPLYLCWTKNFSLRTRENWRQQRVIRRKVSDHQKD